MISLLRVPKKRTSAAKAVYSLYIYGTAEAVPFVRRLFPQPVQPLRYVFPIVGGELSRAGSCGNRKYLTALSAQHFPPLVPRRVDMGSHSHSPDMVGGQSRQNPDLQN
jgi:hypothetical protein